MSKKWLQNIEKATAYLLLFLLPTQLALHFWPSWAFVFGIRVDFLAPAIYLTDILVIILVLTNPDVYRKYIKYLLALFVFAALNTFFSTSPPESLYKWLKIFEMAAVGMYFANVKIGLQKIVTTFFYSAIFFSLIGITQFILGRSVGGLLYFLGERSFGLITPGIALARISGQDFLRAYSTFAHPNSLAGYLGAVLILLPGILKKRVSYMVGAIIILAGFVSTFSLTAFLGLVFALTVKYLFSKPKLFNKTATLVLVVSFFLSLVLPIF